MQLEGHGEKLTWYVDNNKVHVMGDTTGVRVANRDFQHSPTCPVDCKCPDCTSCHCLSSQPELVRAIT